MYAFLGGSSGHAYMIFRVADPDATESALGAKGWKPLTQEQISAI